MRDLIAKLSNAHFMRYFVASIGALAVDMGSFLLLLETPLHAGVSAAIAYTLGIIAHWVLLSRSVFEAGTHTESRARTVQKAVFLLTTWGGLAITTAIVSLAELIDSDVRVSKALAVVISFVLNYFVRKHFVFTAGNAAA